MNFILADSRHDAQLRAILRAECMPGHLRLAYEREPDFFQGMEALGSFYQVVAGEEDGKLLGFGCRSVRPMYVNGRETPFGYLSGLRSSLQGRRRLGLARGYRFFRELNRDGRCPGYLTTIIGGNTEAVATIASGRAGLPHYVDRGECHTCAIPVNRRSFGRSSGAIQVRAAREGEEETVVALLRDFGSDSQFFPTLRAGDFGGPLLRDLRVTDFLIAEKGNEPCGVAALWNQSAFKQHRIVSYSPVLNRVRPLVNSGLKLGGYRPLPAPGDCLSHAYLCFRTARNHDPDIHRALLDEARRRLIPQNVSTLVTGFHLEDPSRIIMRSIPHIRYRSRLYLVGWEKELHTYRELDNRVPYFDPAIL